MKKQIIRKTVLFAQPVTVKKLNTIRSLECVIYAQCVKDVDGSNIKNGDIKNGDTTHEI